MRCSTCRRPDVDLVDAAIERGDSFRSVGRRFRLGKDAVGRHSRHKVRQRRQPVSIATRISLLLGEAIRLIEEARLLASPVAPETTQEQVVVQPPVKDTATPSRAPEPSTGNGAAPGAHALDRLRDLLVRAR